MFTTKFRYLIKSILKNLNGTGFACPSCRHDQGRVVARKYLATSLRRCEQCQLLYRTPTTSEEENQLFYQSAYSQGFTTDLPDAAELTRLVESRFQGSEKDFTRCVEILKILGANPGQRLLDFGCSWGYGSYQFQKAGYIVEGFEISTPRREFAREKLGIAVCSREIELPDRTYDVFFSSHVIEHVPAVSEMFRLAKRVLKPGGLFLALTPNGDESFQHREPAAWQQLWGLVHPQLLDHKFVETALSGLGWLMATTPFPLETMKSHDFVSPSTLDLSGSELLLAFRSIPAP